MEPFGGCSDRVVEAHGLEVEIESSPFYARHVKHVVDEGLQAMGLSRHGRKASFGGGDG
jgi:Ser-tRNA(Ala) deacylase AlaX